MVTARIGDLLDRLGQALRTAGVVTRALRNFALIGAVATAGALWAIIDRWSPAYGAGATVVVGATIAVAPAVAWWRVTAHIATIVTTLDKLSARDFEVLDAERWTETIERLRGGGVSKVRGLVGVSGLLSGVGGEGRDALSAAGRLPTLVVLASAGSALLAAATIVLVPVAGLALAL